MRRLFLFTLLLSGCLVPGLGELESVSPGTCDAEHPCAPGYSCVEDLCQATADLSCEPGTTTVCGRDMGECQRGKATCTAEGRFGPCVGEVTAVAEVCNGKDDDCDGTTDEEALTASCRLQVGVCAGKAQACSKGQVEAECSVLSYGAAYEETETSCDNLDNDCDGDTDEALTQACANQQGVCQGARQACNAGTYSACNAEVYKGHSEAYQAFEQSCDGQDNDCDGQVDTWAPLNLSRTTPADGPPDTVRSLKVAALSLPPESGSQAPTVLTLYEEGDRVLARTFYADGKVSPGRVPSATIPQASRVTAPVLATNGLVHVGAWIEELPPNDGVVTYRVMVARLGNDGVSNVPPDRAAIPVFDRGRPERLALTVSNSRLLVVVQQARDSAIPGLWAVTMPLEFPPASSAIKEARLTADATASRPSVFPPRSQNETFFVAYESPTGIQVATVQDDATVSALARLDTDGASQPQIFSDEASTGPQGYTVYFVPSTRDRIAVSRCTGATCSRQPDLTGTTPTGPIEDLRLASRSPMSQEPLLATWVSGGTVQVFLPSAAPGSSLRQVHSAGNAFRRPLPIVIDGEAGGGGKGLVLFDTEGNTSGGMARDEIFGLPVCLP